VLLEIALWQPLSSFTISENEHPDGFRDRLLGMSKRELPNLVGRIYAEATRKCLEIKGGGQEDRHETTKICSRVVEELEKCVV
jgi:hypothetical protein